MAKVIDNKNEVLRCHAINLLNDLEPLQSSYLKKHNLTTIAPVVRISEQTCTMGKLFNNLPPTIQIQMMYAILNKEETRLYAMIRATLKSIDTILQE